MPEDFPIGNRRLGQRHLSEILLFPFVGKERKLYLGVRMSKKDQHERLLDEDMDHQADAEVLLTELLRDSQQGPLKKVVASVLSTAGEGVSELRHLYERRPYGGLLIAGCVGLALGLVVSRKSSD